MDTFSERLKQLREEQGVTQNEFSKRLGISRVSLTHYEAGDRTPDIEFLKRLHQETGVSLYYLLGLSDSKDDALATAQRDTGLSEQALEYFADHPIGAKAINHMVACQEIQTLAMVVSVLHDDELMHRAIPDDEWSPVMEALRYDHKENLLDELSQAMEQVIAHPSEQPFGVEQRYLPCGAVLETVRRTRQMQKDLEMLSQSPDDEYAQRARQYADAAEAMIAVDTGKLSKALGRLVGSKGLTKKRMREIVQEVVSKDGKTTPE